MYRLEHDDVWLCDSGHSQGVLALRRTKTSARKNAQEFVDLLDGKCAVILRHFLDSTDFKSSPTLLQMTQEKFRQRLQEDVKFFKLPTCKFEFRPYSLRRGGAAEAFRITGNYDMVLHRGRWTSIRTAEIYLHDARATVVDLAHNDQKSPDLQKFEAMYTRQCEKKGWCG